MCESFVVIMNATPAFFWSQSTHHHLKQLCFNTHTQKKKPFNNCKLSYDQHHILELDNLKVAQQELIPVIYMHNYDNNHENPSAKVYAVNLKLVLIFFLLFTAKSYFNVHKGKLQKICGHQ